MGMQCKLVSFPEKIPDRSGPIQCQQRRCESGGWFSLHDHWPGFTWWIEFKNECRFTNEPISSEFCFFFFFERRHFRRIHGSTFVLKCRFRCDETLRAMCTYNSWSDYRRKGKEPLATLSTFRNFDHKVLFGQNMVALNEGTIELNAEITLIK